MKLEIFRNGTYYDISSICKRVEMVGMGYAPAIHYGSSYAEQDGENYAGFRLQARVFTIRFVISGSNYAETENKLESLISYFPYSQTAIKMRFTKDNGIVKIVDAFVTDIPVDHKQRGFNYDIAITFKAPDPLLYAPDADNIAFFSVNANFFRVPTIVPTRIGDYVTSESVAVNVEGTFNSYPVIRIIGPMTNPKIVNHSTNEKIELIASIKYGEYIDIDLRPGFKTIFNSLGVNLITKLTNDSDLTDFHMAVPPELPDGINDMEVTGYGLTYVSRINVGFSEKYLSL